LLLKYPTKIGRGAKSERRSYCFHRLICGCQHNNGTFRNQAVLDLNRCCVGVVAKESVQSRFAHAACLRQIRHGKAFVPPDIRSGPYGCAAPGIRRNCGIHYPQQPLGGYAGRKVKCICFVQKGTPCQRAGVPF